MDRGRVGVSHRRLCCGVRPRLESAVSMLSPVIPPRRRVLVAPFRQWSLPATPPGTHPGAGFATRHTLVGVRVHGHALDLGCGYNPPVPNTDCHPDQDCGASSRGCDSHSEPSAVIISSSGALFAGASLRLRRRSKRSVDLPQIELSPPAPARPVGCGTAAGSPR